MGVLFSKIPKFFHRRGATTKSRERLDFDRLRGSAAIDRAVLGSAPARRSGAKANPSGSRSSATKAGAAQYETSIARLAGHRSERKAGISQWPAELGLGLGGVVQCYATVDIGLIAYETAAREGLVLDEGVIVEIVRPGTSDPVLDGEVGELVVTTLNPDYPLIRFGTGDLSALLPGRCPTGRTNRRIRGWMGRADQTTKVRGMFVHPGQVADIVRRHREVIKARLVMDGEVARDRMTLQVEVSERPEGLAERIAGSVREVTRLRSDVLVLPPGSLPNDGKLIEDARSYR